jgi:hypothetical protein
VRAVGERERLSRSGGMPLESLTKHEGARFARLQVLDELGVEIDDPVVRNPSLVQLALPSAIAVGTARRDDLGRGDRVSSSSPSTSS